MQSLLSPTAAWTDQLGHTSLLHLNAVNNYQKVIVTNQRGRRASREVLGVGIQGQNLPLAPELTRQTA